MYPICARKYAHTKMNSIADQNIHPPFPQQPLRQRALNSALITPNVWPKWFSKYPIAVYLLALGAVTLMYSAYSMPWYYMLSGVVAVLAFFQYGSKAVKDLAPSRIRKEKTFEKRIFTIRALQIQGSASHSPTLRKMSLTASAACIFIQCANRAQILSKGPLR